MYIRVATSPVSEVLLAAWDIYRMYQIGLQVVFDYSGTMGQNVFLCLSSQQQRLRDA